jgi:hypothetical protein
LGSPFNKPTGFSRGSLTFDGLNLSGKFEGFVPQAHALDGLATDSESLIAIDGVPES